MTSRHMTVHSSFSTTSIYVLYHRRDTDQEKAGHPHHQNEADFRRDGR